MSILSRVNLISQERLDLEDVNSLLSALRTDSKLWTEQFLSGENYIVKGFAATGLGLKQATVAMDSATLIHGQNTYDFSYYIAEPGVSNITIPDVDLLDGSRNYVEIKLVNEENTPVARAFWDPSANSGSGAEFSQQINTMIDLAIEVEVRQGGFSGDPDNIKLCIIDTDVSGNINLILDKRPLFFRLGTEIDPSNEFSWSSQLEPPYTMTLVGGTGTFLAGELITFSSGAVATVVSGGTTNITFKLPDNDNFQAGDTVIGADSSASRNAVSIIESFTGADKDIDDFKELVTAIQTELKSMKGSDFWYEDIGESILGNAQDIDAIEAVLAENAYEEPIELISGAPADDNELTGPVSSGTVITLPTDKKDGGSTQEYVVGEGVLEIFLNGQY